jgi:hypothetical protein
MIIGGYDEKAIEARGTKRDGSEEDKHNSRKTDDGIFWMPLNSAHYWQVDMYEANVGVRNLPFTGLADAVINSGASYAYIP